MKHFHRNIVLFLLPLLVLILIMPVNQRLKYIGLKHDCFNHGIWIYDRIFNNSKPIDVVFLGSSHTINGINDQLIEENIHNDQLAVVNFGYCRLGRNLDYVLLKEILKKKHPKYLFLEVREDEDRYSHPIFPYIASDKDVLFPWPFFDKNILSDIWTHFSYKIELFQDWIFFNTLEMPIRKNDFGFASSTDTASGKILNETKLKRNKPRPELTKPERDFHMSFARGYIKRIHKICKENHIKVVFLYLPSYGTSLNKPKEYDTYLKYGEVWIPPDQIMQNPAHWHDENHLNRAGAAQLSQWIADKIKKNKGFNLSNHIPINGPIMTNTSN